MQTVKMAAALALTALLMACGAGIPEEEHQAVKDELAAEKAKNQELLAEIEAVQAGGTGEATAATGPTEEEIAELQASIEELNGLLSQRDARIAEMDARIANLQAELNAAEEEVQTAGAERDAAVARMEGIRLQLVTLEEEAAEAREAVEIVRADFEEYTESVSIYMTQLRSGAARNATYEREVAQQASAQYTGQIRELREQNESMRRILASQGMLSAGGSGSASGSASAGGSGSTETAVDFRSNLGNSSDTLPAGRDTVESR